jgi:hypothetical protein
MLLGVEAPNGDVDLFLKEGSEPTINDVDCSQAGASSVEECTRAVQPPTAMYAWVYGYANTSDIYYTCAEATSTTTTSSISRGNPDLP